LRDLSVTLRQLANFRKAGTLDEATFERLQNGILARRRELMAPEPKPAVQRVPAPPAKPVSPPVPVAPPVPLVETPPQTIHAPGKAELPEVLPVVERVPQRVESLPRRVEREEHVVVAPVPAVRLAPPAKPAPPPKPPRRSLAEVLAAFMEERNILWGELIGGLLMVGCSIALVISLWKTLEEIPYFPFLIFAAITSSIFGAGLYTFHHWKLESTSRGLLVIAIFLVPLNFLVMAGLSVQDQWGYEPFRIAFRVGSEAVALALFTLLMNGAARVLVPNGRWPLILAVLGASTSQLAVHWFVPRQETGLWPFFLLALWPVACQVGNAAVFLYRTSRRQPLDERQASGLFAFLGMATFALTVALAFLVYWSDDRGLALERLSVLIAVTGTPILAGGLLVHRGLADQPAPSGTPTGSTAAVRTAGTATALAGMAVMLSALVLAWPQPAAIMLVAVLNFAVLTAVAFLYRLPVAHGAALPCLALSYLMAFHLLWGPLSVTQPKLGLDLLNTVFSAPSGSALVFLVVLLGTAAEFLVRAGHRPHGAFYAAGSGILALVSLALVNLHGPEDPARAAMVTGIYAVGSLAMNLRWRRAAVSYLGLALVGVSTLWALWRIEGDVTPLWGTALAVEALLLTVVAVFGRSQALTLTAWRDMAAAVGGLALVLALGTIDRSGFHTCTGGVLALTAFLLAWAYRFAGLTWVGSALVLGSLVHALGWTFTDLHLRHPGLVSFLAHATLVLLSSLELKTTRWAKPVSSDQGNADLHGLGVSIQRIFAAPLYQSAFVSSLVALPLLLVAAWGEMEPLAAYMGWLSAIWLVIAWTARWPVLFAAFQAALTATVLLSVTAWLEGQSWVSGHYPEGLSDPWSLQAYGVGLGALALLWLTARLILRSNAVAQRLLEPAWPAVDWVVLGVLVLAQFGLAIWGILPGVVQELTPIDIGTWPTVYAHAFGTGAWVLLGVLAIVLTVALWERQQQAAVLGIVILALTIPLLVAGRFAEERAAASALRWGLGLCFLVCSVPLWLRDSLARLASRVGIERGNAAEFSRLSLAAQVRGLLLACAIVPVLVLTAVVAGIWFSGQSPTGPAPDSIFVIFTPIRGLFPGTISPAGSYWLLLGQALRETPLILISLGLVGHALRERSAGYAFSAGLIVNLTVTIGYYALGVVARGQTFGEMEWVRLVQLGALTAALWALACLASRPWVAAWREGPTSPLAGPLMTLQIGMSAAANVLLLLVALWLLIIFFPEQTQWTTETGSPLGWIALATATGAGVWRSGFQRSQPYSHFLGLMGMAILGLLACTITGLWPEWGYRALMLGWAVYTPALVLAAWLSEKVRAREPEGAGHSSHSYISLLSHSFTPQVAALWVRVAGILVILLSLRVVIVHQEDHLWAAAAVALASSAGAAMAVWRRREDWAFVAGLGVHLAASLVVWHFYLLDPFTQWWVYLVQANVIAGAVVALLWLTARKQLYDRPELSFTTGPLLTVQVSLGLCGNFVLLLWPLICLLVEPGQPLPPELRPVGFISGWLALLLSVVAFFWYADQVAPRSRGHVLVVFGLALAILAACSASRGTGPGDWLAYHVLLATWTGTGLVILAAEHVAKLRDGQVEDFSSLPRIAQFLHFSTAHFRGWLNTISLLVLGLAVRGTWEDPARPYWPAGATLAVSALAGAVAVRSRSSWYVYLSGILINLAGGMAWVAWGPPSVASFGYTQVLCLALAAAFWSILEMALQARTPPLSLRGRSLPFTHVAAVLGLCVLTLLVGLALVSDLTAGGIGETGVLPWSALAVLLGALVIGLWDREAKFTCGGLYAVGLLAIGLALHTWQPELEMLRWIAALALASYILLTSAISWAAPELKGLGRVLYLPDRPVRWPEAWFAPLQSLLACVVVALSLSLALEYTIRMERLVGPLSVLLLLPAGVLLASSTPSRWGSQLRYATLTLGVVAVTECGWALLDPSLPALWLYRSLLMMISLALMTLVYGVGLAKLLPWPSAWAVCGRRLGPILGFLASLMVLAVLAQEGLLYDFPMGRTSMEPVAIAAVALALVGMIAAGIYFAVVPGRDPFGLSEQGRMLYVYAGEVLLVLLLVHFRLTVPELFRLGLVRYWPFIVMAIAFLGVGLSEYLGRKGLRVLSEPLRHTGVYLPLLPLLVFWVVPQTAAQQVEWMVLSSYRNYGVLWFLVGTLYTLVALTRRSFPFALLAALAGNAGLWALLHHNNLAFLAHPQMWLIPLALVILVAEHLNRDRLSEPQSSALRYLSLLAIYVSSTADMFIAGLGQSPVWPLVLAILSVTGVLAGILLRVRAFLYLGTTFLFVVITSMIWHAAVNRHQMWVWWASGIVLGAAIIALFAVFEKRRNDILKLLEEIKQWD
jgi:hypothetical protein